MLNILASGQGRALLFLLPSELGFLKYLRAAKATLNEYEFPGMSICDWGTPMSIPMSTHNVTFFFFFFFFKVAKISNVQSQLERLVEKNYYLHKSARDGYRSYLLSYASHSHKQIFDVHTLDLQATSKGKFFFFFFFLSFLSDFLIIFILFAISTQVLVLVYHLKLI